METHQCESKKRVRWHIIPFLVPIYFYRWCISPLLGPRCRFEPTCSCYAEQAIIQYGILKGTLLTINRLVKCHPWHSGGYDPVPEKNTKIR